ncbi:hypothetical protein DYBT9275_05950 [Dyadobacter sp. CECT 9275]|uniref:Blue (type 1) copper domain-containing protein n=1 Tax=Dyadobacter helix TaxID=2822344 RepID=A0A916JJ61_9BACT|nr:hypothetical protein DYBT9275_05950 [Dyadobacter sp. CECT 9275]
MGNLKAYEDRFRYRTRLVLREKAPEVLFPEIQKWLAALDKNDEQYEHHLLEALWLYQDFDIVEEKLLKRLLNAKQYEARTAAVKVLRYWHDRIPGALALMKTAVNDPSPRVRLEAVVALSFFNSEEAFLAATDVFNYPTDYYLDYAARETFTFLKPVWLAYFQKNGNFIANRGHLSGYLLNLASKKELARLPQTTEVLTSLLSRTDTDLSDKKEAVAALAKSRKVSTVNVLLETVGSASDKAQAELILILQESDPAVLQEHKQELIRLIREDSSRVVRAGAYAAIVTAEKSDRSVSEIAQENDAHLADYLTGLSYLADPALKVSFYNKVKKLATGTSRTAADKEGIQSPHFPARSSAYTLLLRLPVHTDEKPEIFRNYLAYLATTPEGLQSSALFVNAMADARKLIKEIPLPYQAEAMQALESLGTMEIKLAAVEAKMAFDKDRFTVKAGKKVSLIFENKDLMPHNVLVVGQGSAEKVGEAADAMANLKNGFEKNFVPEIPEVLFATPLVNAGKSYQLNFTAPEKRGEYPFICSFPGHWRVMKGIMIVE